MIRVLRSTGDTTAGDTTSRIYQARIQAQALAFEQAADAHLVLNGEALILDANAAAAALLDASCAALHRRPLRQWIAPADRERFDAYWGASLDGRASSGTSFTITGTTPLAVRAASTVLRDSSGTLVGVHLVLARHTPTAAALGSGPWARLLRAAGEIGWSGFAQETAAALTALLGAPRAALLVRHEDGLRVEADAGWPARERITGRVLSVDETPLAEALAGTVARWRHAEDGSSLDVLASGAHAGLAVPVPVDDAPARVLVALDAPFRVFDAGWQREAERLAQLVALVADRHETLLALETYEQTLGRSAEAERQFLSALSHDIRTPLSAIIGFASVLSDELEEPHREMATYIEDSGKRLDQLLSDILEHGKLEAGRITLDPEPVALAREVEVTVRPFRLTAERQGLALSVEVDEAVRHARAWLDVGALSRILQNLLSNAFKFTGDGSVTLRVQAEGEQLRVDIADTGCGIQPAFMDRLFQAYQREHEGGDTPAGSGLGLAITKRLVDLMDGRIEVTSEVGRGTTFSVFFRRMQES